jgi:hypothetical protein
LWLYLGFCFSDSRVVKCAAEKSGTSVDRPRGPDLQHNTLFVLLLLLQSRQRRSQRTSRWTAEAAIPALCHRPFRIIPRSFPSDLLLFSSRWTEAPRFELNKGAKSLEEHEVRNPETGALVNRRRRHRKHKGGLVKLRQWRGRGLWAMWEHQMRLGSVQAFQGIGGLPHITRLQLSPSTPTFGKT